MGKIEQLEAWKSSKPGLLLAITLEAGLAYVLASYAIDNGQWWAWLLTFFALVGAAQNLVRLIWKLFHDKAARTRRA